VGVPGDGGDDVIHAFVKLEPDVPATDVLQADIKGWMRREMGPNAVPAVVQFARGLPKTRSGELVRSMLRKIAEGEVKDLGDISHLADATVIHDLVNNRATAEA
jgi:acetyl-CoA synthetase